MSKRTPGVLEVVLVTALVGVVLAVALCGPGNGPSRPSSILPALYTRLMDMRSYTPADTPDKPHIADTSLAVLEDAAVQTIYAPGVWTAPDTILPGDSLPIVVSAVELDDGSKWVRLEISGKPVTFHQVDWYTRAARVGRWSAGMEWDLLHGGGAGLFGCYRLATAGKVRVGVALAIDYDQDDPLNPRWAALEVRGSYPVTSSFELGGGVGAGLFPRVPGGDLGDVRAGWHLSVGASFRF